MINLIQYPYVDFMLTKERFDKFTDNYNADLQLSKQLRLVSLRIVLRAHTALYKDHKRP